VEDSRKSVGGGRLLHGSSMRLGVRAAIVDGGLVPGDLEIAEGAIAAVGLPRGGSGLAVPGYVDLQINGFGGVDFLSTDVHGYRKASRALLARGVTAYQPTLITAPKQDLLEAIAVAREAARIGTGGARILGVHLEGPFISPLRPGIHPVGAISAPDLSLMRQLLSAGPVTTVTLAPELPGALDVADFLVRTGVTVSFGHTNASASEANTGFDRGVHTITHLFNAMRPLTHRDPGIVGAALARDDVVVQMILDHYHLARETSLLVRKIAGGRLCLVSDAMPAAGLGDGVYRIGPRDILVKDGRARLADGTIAGSTVTLDQAMRNLVDLGSSIEEAVGAVTSVPARVLRRGDIGLLGVGALADVVILDDELGVSRVLLAGIEVDLPDERLVS
jgi:N-acetylglucosamine-6-phosphate deacetylase